MKIFLLLAMIYAGTRIPFHSISIKNTENQTIGFSAFENKKVLIVNIASNSEDTAQLRELEELHQRYPENLVILAIPGNDFGNEPLTDVQITTLLHTRYDAHYLIGQKQLGQDSLKNADLYQWLTQKNKNGAASSSVNGDFYKYLINGSGQVVGIFSNKIRPLDKALLDVISAR